MSLTPDQIANREFAVGLRGYDQEEVRAFLQLVAVELADSAKELVEAAGPGLDVSSAAATANASVILQKAHDEAVEIRQSAAAEAEIVRSRAKAVLVAAQDEALRLVAEAHVRIDRRGGAIAPGAGGPDARSGSTVEQLGAEISAMVKARDEVLEQLREVKQRVGDAVEAAEADPVLGRAPAGASS